MAGAPPVTHEPSADGGAFVMLRDGKRVGELTYARADGHMTILHTGVDPVLRGSGAARGLLDAAVTLARAENLKVSSRCSYAQAVFAKSPAEFADVLTR